MNMIQIIEKKKNHGELSKVEIDYFIQGYVNNDIPDYQVSALLMAIRLNGMTDEETYLLTDAMIHSGETIDLSEIDGFKVDKHSTGGVGDKVTLVVAPIIASLGIPVAKFSGKGLGITGGTIDKLESIQGFQTELTIAEFVSNVNKHKIAVAGQTGNIVPADKKLYALRDVTGTVDSIPLIASSVMSKKIASGSDGIVLDVKYGSGAFMKTIEDARVLADKMIAIGEKFGKKIVANLSDMNNPLGRFIGNKVEVVEAFDLLSGRFDLTHSDLIDECIEIAAKMYEIATGVSYENAKLKVNDAIQSGVAKDKFLELVKTQHGDTSDLVIRETAYKFEGVSSVSGVVELIDAQTIGEVALELGAGRLTKESALDYDAGVELLCKQGDVVNSGDQLFTIFTNVAGKEYLVEKALSAYQIKR